MAWTRKRILPEGKAVSNASPLIVLHRLGKLDLVRRLFTEVLVPDGVRAEVERGPSGADLVGTLDRLESFGRIEVSVGPNISEWDLGLGESEVLAAASLYPGAVLLLDDLAARRSASTLGYPFTGTVGLLLSAKKKGLIHSLKNDLDAIVSHGFRLSEALRRDALRRAGE